VPADGYETWQVINTVADREGPVYVRLGRPTVPAVMPGEYEFQIGKAHVFSLGRDATVVAVGIMVSAALEAAALLSREGIDVGVINMTTVKPLDGDALLAAAERSSLIVTAEDHSTIGGLGGAVAEFLSETRPRPVRRIGVRDTFGCSGKPDELLRHYGLTGKDIAAVIRAAREGLPRG
jgi:transketolase